MSARLEIGCTSLPAGHSLLVRGPPPAGRPPFDVPPSSSALSSRLRSFLPALASANAALETRIAADGAASVDIEAVAPGSAHIAMDLAVAELASGSELDSSDGSESELGVDATGVGRGGAGAGAASTAAARRIRIQEVGGGAAAGDALEIGGSAAASGVGSGAAAAAAAALPSGEWITGAALAANRADIFKLIAASAAHVGNTDAGSGADEVDKEGDSAEEGGDL